MQNIGQLVIYLVWICVAVIKVCECIVVHLMKAYIKVPTDDSLKAVRDGTYVYGYAVGYACRHETNVKS